MLKKFKGVGTSFVRGAYAVAVAFLFILMLRTVAVQITPPPAPLNEPYPNINTPALCEEAGGAWVEDIRSGSEHPVPVKLETEDEFTGYCQGPLAFERQRQQVEEASRQTSLFVFAVGGAVAVATGALLSGVSVLPAGFLLGGIVAFFVAGIQLWQLVPGVGRTITMVVLFCFLIAVGWYVFREDTGKK